MGFCIAECFVTHTRYRSFCGREIKVISLDTSISKKAFGLLRFSWKLQVRVRTRFGDTHLAIGADSWRQSDSDESPSS